MIPLLCCLISFGTQNPTDFEGAIEGDQHLLVNRQIYAARGIGELRDGKAKYLVTIESAQSAKKKPRIQWPEKDTRALIKLWKDHLDALRGQKHNGGVYQAIAESLTDAGIPRTQAQVHSKIDNLTQTLEWAQQTEVELRSKHLQPKEKLVNALVGFINKT
nr:uncharacterized protein LOC119167008 [Rhipicephalus microplus]